MGKRPVEIFLFCDPEDIPLARALSEQLSGIGIVSAYGHEFADTVDRCKAVAVCVGENSRSLTPEICRAIQNQLDSQGFRVVILFLPTAWREDSVWLPEHWIQFKSDPDPVAQQALVAVIRPSLRIFLCHSSSDKPHARILHQKLISDGFQPWLDEIDLIPGQDWELTIRSEVRASHVVVVCLSCAAVAKTGFMQKEIRLALDFADEQPEGSIFLITARLEECDVPIRLNKWHRVDLWLPEGYERLLQGLRLRATELRMTIASGLTRAEVAQLSSWRPVPRGRTVLVVGGNPDLLRFVSRVLEQKGWTAVFSDSADGAAKVMWMSPEVPTVALIDYRLPDSNGVEFAVKLQNLRPTMAVAIMSNDQLV